GEAAAGMHGANRLGGTSLSDLLVFGRRAGAGAAAYAKRLTSPPRPNEAEIEAEARALLQPFDRSAGESPYEVHRTLQDCMDRLVGIFRVQADLDTAGAPPHGLRGRAAQRRVDAHPPLSP